MTQISSFAPDSLVIREDGSRSARMSTNQAQQIAQENGLDLIEVDRQGDLSICRIMDRGKWEYEQKKKLKKEHSHHAQQKEIKISVRIDAHDLDIKINKIRQLLDKKSDVKIVVEMRGREKYNPVAAMDMMNQIISSVPGYKYNEMKKSVFNVFTILHHH